MFMKKKDFRIDSLTRHCQPSPKTKRRRKSLEQFLTFFYFCLQLEGRKISSNQFLKVLSTLRVWEICAPNINAAVEVSIVDLTQ